MGESVGDGMTRIQRLIAWVTKAATLPERQCEAILLEAMRRAGWKKVTRMQKVRGRWRLQ